MAPMRRVNTASLQDAWQQLLDQSGATPALAAALFLRLQVRYTAPERAYHNLAHIRDVLAVVDTLAAHCPQPDAVRLAAWLHDVVYVPGARDNERQSAAWATAELAAAGVSPALGAESARLILLTASHDPAPTDGNGAVLVDADLAILGTAPPQYDRYARAIRQEYAAVPDAVYQPGRARVLRRFLARPAIYHTAPMRATHEAAARRNLTRELDTLLA
jgi:predicted metal-dependent HD superfamily phosphohydrolase